MGPAEGIMKKARKPTSTTKGGGSYAMFLPDGTPSVVARQPTTAVRTPGKIEFPN
jgi:hypothetical protein